ncbi:predicted protein [Chaetoceros tenuissimus]|uniref:Uncharacterized protein n=1 Tax=Chaetoceros tenuissimus TaxID=426638 RepID=A0AAD3HA71_9STRA|nr:predicted protein [Chaetoceros tenuissimus]
MEWLPKASQKQEKPASFDCTNEQTCLFMESRYRPPYDPFVPSHSDPGSRDGVGNFTVLSISGNNYFVATDAGSSISNNSSVATLVKQKAHSSIRTTAATTNVKPASPNEREVIAFDHTKNVNEDASLLLENIDNIAWDENLWQREFVLKQQQSLLPDDLSKLNSVFD